jgi:hypothetical protein
MKTTIVVVLFLQALTYLPRCCRNAGEGVEIEAVRVANLRRLIDQYAGGNLSKYTDEQGLSYKVLQRVLSPRGGRNLGSNMARRIEERHKLRPGWLDTDRSEAGPEVVPGGRSDRAVRLAQMFELLPPASSELLAQFLETLIVPPKKKRRRRK